MTTSSPTRGSSWSPGSGRRAVRHARAEALVGPEDAKGQKVRGGSPRNGHDVQGAPAPRSLSMPSNETYAAMQTGAADAIAYVIDEPYLLPPGRVGKAPYHRPRQILLVHVRAFDDVEGDFRRAAEGSAERDHGNRCIARELRRHAAKADDEEVVKVYKERRDRSTISMMPRLPSGGTSRAKPRGRTTRQIRDDGALHEARRSRGGEEPP